MSPHESIAMKIAELETAILSAHPTLPTLLSQIHSNLKSDPDIVTLLDPAEVAVIVRGLEIQTKTTIASSIVKEGKGVDKKKLAQISLDDI